MVAELPAALPVRLITGALGHVVINRSGADADRRSVLRIRVSLPQRSCGDDPSKVCRWPTTMSNRLDGREFHRELHRPGVWAFARMPDRGVAISVTGMDEVPASLLQNLCDRVAAATR